MIDFSKKENIKIAVMLGLAVVLVIVLVKRFSGGRADEQPFSAEAGHEQIVMPQLQKVKRDYNKATVKRAAVNWKNMKSYSPKAPPFLTRDIFNSRNRDISPKRKAERVKEVPLELTATIVDDQSALAIIGSEVLVTGDTVKGFRVTAIKNNEVVLSKGKRRYVLRISEE